MHGNDLFALNLEEFAVAHGHEMPRGGNIQPGPSPRRHSRRLLVSRSTSVYSANNKQSESKAFLFNLSFT